ncbi:MAG: thrombospondin type 3 repeat-containing protein, partial [Myxococcales bacterium]|nr:thrombospondin type 3 repeat-containing protein [Myxococcales bacterium]
MISLGFNRKTAIAATAVCLCLGSPQWASAEGTQEIIGDDPLGFESVCDEFVSNSEVDDCPFQGLNATTRPNADILHPEDEVAVFCTQEEPDREEFTYQVVLPNSSTLLSDGVDTEFEFGQVINFSGRPAGAYEFRLPTGNRTDGDFESSLGDMFSIPNTSGNVDRHGAKYWWDVQVLDADCLTAHPGLNLCDLSAREASGCEIDGRVWATRWRFNAGTFNGDPDASTDSATDANYYAVVPSGTPGQTAVIELDLDGLAGYVYNITANRTGVDGINGGRSVFRRQLVNGQVVANSVQPEYRMYLNPPEQADYQVTPPDFSLLPPIEVSVGAGDCTNGGDPPLYLAPYETEVSIRFESNVEGTYQFICDFNYDGRYDVADDEDLLINGILSTEQTNEIIWDGLDEDGNPPLYGDSLANSIPLSCVLQLTVGEFHYVGDDMETSFAGMRIFEVEANGDRNGLDMYWNDAQVQQCDIPLYGSISLYGAETSGPWGINSGDISDEVEPVAQIRGGLLQNRGGTGCNSIARPCPANTCLDGELCMDGFCQDAFCAGNSRAWGAFTGQTSEALIYGLNALACPNDWTDGRPTNTGASKGNGAFLDTFVWLASDRSDPIVFEVVDWRLDTDRDFLIDTEEVCNTETDWQNPDSDNDSPVCGEEQVTFMQRNEDGELVQVTLSRHTSSTCPLNDYYETENGQPGIDFDEDGLTNANDPDDDNDGLLSSLEHDEDNDPPSYDTDNDGHPNYLDADDDNDSVPTRDEDLDDDRDYNEHDTDDDGIPNYLDPDDDGDTVDTEDEDVNGNGDPQDDDTDDDGIPNYLDVDDDGDTVLTEDEDVNGDGDPRNDDTDSDSIPNYLDPDDDGDSVPTEDEDINQNGDPRDDDTDDDGTPNYLDPDDDGDGIPSIDEDANDNGDLWDDDTDGDTVPDYLDPEDGNGDIDNDGERDIDDNCPLIPNPDQSDIDDDGIGDVCDDDRDGDGLPNAQDNCADVPNPGQNDADNDGIGDVCDDDRDGDGILNEGDNCPDTPNTNQADVNRDGVGDACQSDEDNDGIPDVADNCPSVYNPDQGNVDGDSNGDVCDDDLDDDGLSNDEEEEIGTDPYVRDTDGG